MVTHPIAGEETQLRRAISGRLLLLFILGDVLGAGIYALLGEIGAEVGGALWAPLLLALGFALCTGFSYAELVTKYPRAGGAAAFAQRAFKTPLISFLVGFSMLAAGVTSAAALSQAFAGDYLADIVTVPTTTAALVVLAAIALLNSRGIRESLGANVVMTIIELTGLLLVVVLGVLTVLAGDGDPGRAVEVSGDQAWPLAILAASALAFYSFVGFETSANVAEETQDPRRAFPRALLGGLVIAGVMYCLVGLAVAMAVSTDRLTSTSGPLLEVVRGAPVSVPTELFSVIALVAVANGALLTMIMASRLTYGMAHERLLPGPLAWVSPTRRTPIAAIVVTTLCAAALVLTGGLATLAQTTVLLLLVVFTSANIAVLVLRRDPVEHDHFRTPAVFPVAGVAVSIGLATQQPAEVWLRAGLLLLAGGALWVIARLAARARWRPAPPQAR